jgi:hypothetical protein
METVCVFGLRGPFQDRIMGHSMIPIHFGKRWSLALFLLFGACIHAAAPPPRVKVAVPYFGIHVIDSATGRGVPLVELRTVNNIVLHSDSGGWVAFHEPGLMNREVYFAVSGPGYEVAKDGFGFRGVRLVTTPGRSATVTVKRTNIAERLYRVTGQGIHRDAELLGRRVPRNLAGGVVGQDSVQAVPYRGRIFWLWGDTNLANYPLGNFQTSAGTSPLPGKGFDPSDGVPLDYFVDPKTAQSRRMVPLEGPGPVWLFGLIALPDDKGKPALVAHFTRQKSLDEVVEHGLVRFDDAAGLFTKIAAFDLKDAWRHPRGNAFRHGDTFYFAAPLAYTRVKAAWADLRDPTKYEAFAFDPASGKYAWQRDAGPTTQADERRLLRAGTMKPEAARYSFLDAKKRPVSIHGASIAYNAYRKRWTLVGVQQDPKATPSHLGEVWYAEADALTGPWHRAVKIATHPRYSFYNPRHHPFLDEDRGRVITFEGTYTRTFSGNPTPTPRYEYNQLMYRLDLSDERLKAAR